MYKFYNPNPTGNIVGDCVIRTITKALNSSWEQTYIEVAMQGFMMSDMPSSNRVWELYLKGKGFKKMLLPDSCPDCYTVSEFCQDNPDGVYILCCGNHVLTAVDGDYYDTWDSGDETVLYYFVKMK